MNLNLGIHYVTSVTTQVRRLNGQWQLKVIARCEDGSESEITMYTPSRISVIDLPDEYVQVSGGEYTVERSKTPFEAACSADSGAAK